MDPKDYSAVLADPKQVSDRIFGSKIVIGLEQCMLFSTWGVKTCMLIFYWRLTQSLRSNLYIKILTGYVAVFNISSDAIMFAIPIPLLIRAQLKKHRKILLLCVMSLGLFTIIAAILNKFFNFASPLTTTYQIWYIREASTAIYVANLMCWWPLLRKLFGFKAFSYNSNRRREGLNNGNKFSNSSAANSQSRPLFPCPGRCNSFGRA
ncbi:hypothetical protein N7470_010409 [Penicillium chermesinum]|nr:hypothetical protein N7470_010409 [Penicillium chermesinum]